MRMVKVLGMVVLGLLVLVAIGIAALALNHRSHLRQEAESYPAPGTMVDVGGQRLHVYAHGDGERTLVFMAGHGTSNPTLDFKPLWERMVDEYRIVVVEKAGYGWSEPSDTPRDIETMLAETRQALERAGESGPYVLVPHSMSGLEAIHWGQRYPEEVEAIIGLDPLVPAAVDVLPEPSSTGLYVSYLVSRIGLSRLMPEDDRATLLPLMGSEELTDDEKERYLALFHRSAVTTPMLEEVRQLKGNARIVGDLGPPESIPLYFFISEDQERDVAGWAAALTEYLAGVDRGESRALDTGHYVHYEKADVIAEESKAFLEELR